MFLIRSSGSNSSTRPTGGRGMKGLAPQAEPVAFEFVPWYLRLKRVKLQ
jgi:hypothetical protein